VAIGILIACWAAALREAIGFVAMPPTSMPRLAAEAAVMAPPEEDVWVSCSPGKRLEVPRGEVAPRTAMYAAAKDRTRNHGGGRHTIKMNRNPSLAYSFADENENANGVLRRMWDMYDMNFHKMITMRQRFHRPMYREKRWTADYNMRLGRRKNDMRLLRQTEEQYQQYMVTDGRRAGLQEPIIFESIAEEPTIFFSREVDDAIR